MTIQEKIRGREAKIAVVGLGPVGLRAAVTFARAGLTVIGLTPIAAMWLRSTRATPGPGSGNDGPQSHLPVLVIEIDLAAAQMIN